MKIKGSIKIIEPTKQYGNFQPEIEIEREVQSSVIREEIRDMQDLLNEALAYQTALMDTKDNPDAEKFSKLPLDIKKFFTLVTYDYCAKRNWGITKIKTDMLKLYNERLGDGVAEEIMNKIGEKK